MRGTFVSPRTSTKCELSYLQCKLSLWRCGKECYLKAQMILQKTLVVVGTRRSFFPGNQRVIGSHAKWEFVIGHRRLRRPTRTNDNRCFLGLSFRLNPTFQTSNGCTFAVVDESAMTGWSTILSKWFIVIINSHYSKFSLQLSTVVRSCRM